MLYILGAGCAYPETQIDNALLVKLGLGHSTSTIKENTGINLRLSSLDLDYLLSTKNNPETFGGIKTIATPSDLAERAARVALERAKIAPEQIGLIIGDSNTAVQTTPSEGQRVGQRLGLARVPAYDVSGGCSSFALHIETLLNWKDERIPEYVLIVSANTPTQCVDYRSGSFPLYVGDAASACVLSSRVKGKLLIKDASYTTDPGHVEKIAIKIYEHAVFNENAMKTFVEKSAQKQLDAACNKLNLHPSKCNINFPEMFPVIAEKLAKKYEVPREQLLNLSAETGYSLSSAPGCVVAASWDKIKSGDYVVVMAGAGLSSGYVVLEGQP